MRLPRKGILIRILIYGILLAIVLPPAVKRFFAESEAQKQVQQSVEPDLEGLDKKTIVGPDGKKMEYFELTPEEFEQRFGRPPPEQGPAFEPQKPIPDGAEPGESTAGVEADAGGLEASKGADDNSVDAAPALADDTIGEAKPDPVEAPTG